MAIPSNYIDKITKEGDSRMICPAADKVRVENQNFESDDLDGALNELAGGKANKDETYTKEEVNEKVPLRIAAIKNGDVITSTTDYGEIANAVKEDWRDAYVVVNNEAIFSFYQVEQNAIIFTRVDAEDGTQAYLAVSSNNVWSIEYSAISGGGEGTVTGVKVGEVTYPPNTEGVVDISMPISNKVDKVTGKGLSTNDYTDAEKTKLAGIESGAEANVINGIKAHGASTNLPVTNGVVELPENEAGGLTEADISVSSNQDGTVDFTFGADTYTINLNHTHENMAKLVVCEESDLPSTLDPATIYAQVDDAESPTEIQSLWIAGLEFVGGGGGEPDYTPKLTSPRNGATIDFDGQSTATIVVKGRNLTSNLSVVATGDFTVTANGQSVSTIDAANVTDGASLSLLLTKGSNFVGGTIVIRSADLDEDVTLSITDSSEFAALTGVKFTGTQWLETDYKANTKTEFILKCKLETNSITDVLDNVNRKNWILGGNDAQGCYELYHISQGSGAPYNLVFSLNSLSSSNTINSNANNMLADPLIIQYNKTDGRLTAGTASTSVTAKTGNNSANLRICCRLTSGEDVCYSRFYLTIYEFTIIEDGENVRHYIPMRRFGSPGLYDTVTGSFLTSRTNDPLVEVNS